jgi:hypothetical protein
MAHRVLENVSNAARRKAFEELVEFLMTPAFGSWSKREIELKVFELLYRDRLDALSVGDVATELAVTRSRARSLILETRTRLLADPSQRAAALRDLLISWPRKAEVEAENNRLRLVIDDPFLRDLVRNHAYTAGLLLDTSFASEIVSLRWSDYVKLLASVLDDRDAREIEKDVGAAIRLKLSSDEEARVKFEQQLAKWRSDSSGPAARAKRILQRAPEYVPVSTLANIAIGAIT